MSLELWGGHEMTLNRVGSQYFDQTVRSGHHQRLGDLNLFAELGIKSLRYPVLWERTAPNALEELDFSWSDERLHRIRALRLRPIVGLLHHGSGPSYTGLLDPSFCVQFAQYAGAVAERYPWVEDWTPINEPLTTARFCCLYGLWHPHERSERACWHALFNQIDATRMAMAEIRRIIPHARLVQTEDLGFCHSTPPLEQQADFENHRRWLTWDLLAGNVVPGHPLWSRLVEHGFERQMVAIARDPYAPDIIGVNHYLTSERFLDHRLEQYPGISPAADGPGPFINVEAVRVVKDGPLGITKLLEQAWDRYHITLAVTECHNGCTRDEQARWFLETWAAAKALNSRIPVAAVTSWSLLGSFDWNERVTLDAGYYEPGAFDVRSGAPRPTALAHLIRALADDAEPRVLGLGAPGWWRRNDRLLYPAFESIVSADRSACAVELSCRSEGPILITGKTGTLGRALARACARRGLAHVLTGRDELALEDLQRGKEVLDKLSPSAVINAAGFVAIDDAESDPGACMIANVHGPENLAKLCHERAIPFVTFSSDQVFDGRKGASYVEDDALNPVNIYGRSKVEAERRVLAVGGRVLVIRTAAFFSPHDGYNFAVSVLRALHGGKTLFVARDLFVSPTYVPDLVDCVLDLLIDGETGIWHLANRGRVSWADFAALIAKRTGIDDSGVVAVSSDTLSTKARRPRDVALGSSRSPMLGSLEGAIDRFVQDCEQHVHSVA